MKMLYITRYDNEQSNVFSLKLYTSEYIMSILHVDARVKRANALSIRNEIFVFKTSNLHLYTMEFI